MRFEGKQEWSPSAALALGLCFTFHATMGWGGPPKKAGSAAAPTTAEIAQCKSLCEARDNVSCPNAPKEAACNSNCAAFATESGSCREQFDAWLDDLSKATWSCDGNGYPHYVGSATGVSAAFWQCYSTTVGAIAKATPAPAFCGVSSNDSYCDNNLAFDCAAQSIACGGDAECKAIESCLDKCPNSNSQPDVLHSCVEKCKSKHSAGLAAFEAFSKCASGCGACGGPTGPTKELWDQLAKPSATTYHAFTHCTLIAP
jgi:hypothetical protein